MQRTGWVGVRKGRPGRDELVIWRAAQSDLRHVDQDLCGHAPDTLPVLQQPGLPWVYFIGSGLPLVWLRRGWVVVPGVLAELVVLKLRILHGIAFRRIRPNSMKNQWKEINGK